MQMILLIGAAVAAVLFLRKQSWTTPPTPTPPPAPGTTLPPNPPKTSTPGTKTATPPLTMLPGTTGTTTQPGPGPGTTIPTEPGLKQLPAAGPVAAPDVVASPKYSTPKATLIDSAEGSQTVVYSAPPIPVPGERSTIDSFMPSPPLSIIDRLIADKSVVH